MLVRSAFMYLLKEAIRHSLKTGLEVDDLVVIGKMHLWKAVDKFDPDMENEKDPGNNIRFLSFVIWDIKHAFQTWGRDTKPVKNMSMDQLKSMTSLDSPVRFGDDGDSDLGTTHGEMLSDTEQELYMAGLLDRDEQAHLASEVINELSPKDSELLSLYHGLDCDGDGITMNEIAELRGVSPQAIHNQMSRVMRAAKRVAQRKKKPT